MHWNLLCYKEICVETADIFSYQSSLDMQQAVYQKIDRSLNPTADTSALSDTKDGRICNDRYVVDRNGMSVRQFYEENAGTEGIDILYYYKYAINYPKSRIDFLRNTQSFFDIYYNPSKSVVNQSKALVLLQLLFKQNKIIYIKNPVRFYVWCDYMLRNETRVLFRSDVLEVKNKTEYRPTFNPVCGFSHQDYFGLG